MSKFVVVDFVSAEGEGMNQKLNLKKNKKLFYNFRQLERSVIFIMLLFYFGGVNDERE